MSQPRLAHAPAELGETDETLTLSLSRCCPHHRGPLTLYGHPLEARLRADDDLVECLSCRALLVLLVGYQHHGDNTSFEPWPAGP